MDKDLEFWVYYLTMTEMQEDWADPTDPGCLKPAEVVKATVVLNDPSDNLCIGAYGKDGKFYQFDSYEGYHSHDFFQKDFDLHGLQVKTRHVKVAAKHLIDLAPQ